MSIFADVADVITLQHALIAAISALATVLVFMWKIVDTYRRECEEDRKKLWAKLMEISPFICTDLSCPDRKRTPIALTLTDTNLSDRGKKQLRGAQPGTA